MIKKRQGRPRKAREEQRVICSVSFSPGVYAVLKTMGNRSKFIESCIIETVARKTNGQLIIK